MTQPSAKYDNAIRHLLENGENRIIPVIVQTEDGLKEEDQKTIGLLGGELKRDLYIVNAFSANIPLSAIPMLALNKRVKKIYYDADFRAV